MPTNYPTSLDTDVSLGTPGTNLGDATEHDDLHINAKDAIKALETEMGVSPSGSYSTVKARLDTGWQHIASASFSAVANVDVTITASTYRWVQIELRVAFTSAGGIRARVNNSSAAIYNRSQAMITAEATPTISSVRTLGDTSWVIGYAAGTQGMTVLHMDPCDSSALISFIAHSHSLATASLSDTTGGTFGGALTSATSISSLRIFPVAGTMTGSYIATGYRL